MRKLNLIVVFDSDLEKVLLCIRAKEPYKGLYNFVGGKVEENETNDEAAYRELFEETGISNKDIKLDHFMDLNYFKYENNIQVYYGILQHEVTLVEEKNKLEWVTINKELLDNSKFAGNYNIPHIIRQIKVYLKDENDIKLIKPTIEYKEQAKEMMDEARKYDANNLDIWAGYSSMQKYEHYEEWLEKLENDLDFENIKPGRVPASTYFLLRKKDNKILGIINIRYELNEYLENFGGHIGYSIRATERKKGYGKKQLELALDKCSEISINNVLITCREDNKESAKVIEACGGIYEDTRFSKEENDNFKRYWIKY